MTNSRTTAANRLACTVLECLDSHVFPKPGATEIFRTMPGPDLAQAVGMTRTQSPWRGARSAAPGSNFWIMDARGATQRELNGRSAQVATAPESHVFTFLNSIPRFGVSSSQLTQDPDRVRSFGGYNTDSQSEDGKCVLGS